VKYFQVSASAQQDRLYLHWGRIGYEPGAEAQSPKQGDYHPINVEGIAYRNSGEMTFGLRSPLSNRDSGNAYVFKVTNVASFLPSGGWTTSAPAVSSPIQLDLGGRGIRGIEWCPDSGCYLIVAGPANGGPLKNETGRETFALYSWNGSNAAEICIPDLSGYAVRPESVEIIEVDGEPRVLFVEDRFKAEGYDTRNAVHWPVSILD
jgi:hypothetical protein